MAIARRRVLIVEDDHKTADIVRLYLERDGYAVTSAYDGMAGLEAARSEPPDLVILDLLLPRMNGLDVCRRLRNECDAPIIMLTALSTEQDKLAGLELGADDYVTKPFSPRELCARVKAVLRRTSEGNDAPQAAADLPGSVPGPGTPRGDGRRRCGPPHPHRISDSGSPVKGAGAVVQPGSAGGTGAGLRL